MTPAGTVPRRVLKQKVSAAGQAAQPVGELEAEVLERVFPSVLVLGLAEHSVRADAHGPDALELLSRQSRNQRWSRHAKSRRSPSTSPTVKKKPTPRGSPAIAAGGAVGDRD